MNDNEQLDKLFERAVTLPPEERQRFVEQKCQGDLQLAAELTSLIRHYEKVHDEGYLEDVQAQEIFGMLRGSDAPGDWAENLECGQVGHYRLLGKIGEGGMGAVYRAVHVKLEKQFAVKILPHNQTRNQNAVARFEREMKAVGQLAHPNIVTASYADQHDGIHYLVVELVDGWDFETLLAAHGRLPLVDACELIRQAAIGLQHAFEHGLVHRDIKPSNLMLNRAGQVKVLDLGLACLHSTEGEKTDLTPSGQILGTPSYMSPEQVLGAHGVDIRSDIYSLGVTLYTLLAGEPPFSGAAYDTPAKKMVALASEEPPRIGERCPELPTELIKIVDQMMARDPAGRYREPVAVAEALVQFAENSDLLAMSARTQEICKTGPVDGSLQSTASQAKSALQDTHTELHPFPKWNSDSPWRMKWPRGSVALASVLMVMVVMCAAIVIRIPRGPMTVDAGHLRIHMTAAATSPLTIRILQEQEVIKDLIVEPGKDGKIRLAQGRYRIELNGLEADSFQVDEEEIVIRSRQVAVATIESTQDRLKITDDAVEAWIQNGALREPIEHWTVIPMPPVGSVTKLAVSSDGGMFAYATKSGQLHVRRSDNFQFVCALTEHDGDIAALAWRPDSRVLVSGHHDGTVRWWRSAETCTRFKSSAQPKTGVAWSSDGARCAVVCVRHQLPAEVEIRDDEGSQLFSINFEPLSEKMLSYTASGGVAWSPDGRQLATGHRRGVAIWNVHETRGEFEAFIPLVNYGTSISWGPLGLVVAQNDEALKIITTSKREIVVEAAGYCNEVRWSPDGQTFVSAGTKGVRTWSSDGKFIAEASPSTGSIAWDPNGGRFLVGNERELAWVSTDSLNRRQSFRFAPPSRRMDLFWQPDGKALIATTDRHVATFNTDGTLVSRVLFSQAEVNRACWSTDRQWLASMNSQDRISVWNRITSENYQIEDEVHPRTRFAWSNNGLLAIARGRHLRIWQRQAELAEFELAHMANTMRWGPKDRFLAVGAPKLDGATVLRIADKEDFDVQVASVIAGWAATDQTGIRDSPIFAFDETGEFLTGGAAYGDLLLVDLNSGEQRWLSRNWSDRPVAHRFRVSAFAWHPRKRLLSSVSIDGRFALWNDDFTRYVVHEPGGPLSAAAWNCDGWWLAAAGSSENITVYNDDGSPYSVLPGHVGGIVAIAWHPVDRNRLAAMTGLGTIWQWNVEAVHPFSVVFDRGTGSVLRFSRDGLMQGENQEDLDYIHAHCMFRTTGYDGTKKLVPYSVFKSARNDR